MPIGVPFAASSREPKERDREIPSRVKRACLLMIELGIDRNAAARRVGLRPDSLRRWLHERAVLAFLRQGHDHHLATLCAANPTKLAEIRDTSPNWTSRVQAIRTMEGMGEDVSLRRTTETTPGIVLNLVTVAASPLPQPIEPVKVPLIDPDTGE
jgi:hypothetical protein